MDLLKAYDCLRNDLLMVKLDPYGPSNGISNHFLDYLSFKKQ